MLNNRYMQITTHEINRESIITVLNNLQYLFHNMHLKLMYVHVATELLEIDFQIKTICMLRYYKHYSKSQHHQ